MQPILLIAAALSDKSPFLQPMQRRDEAKAVQQEANLPTPPSLQSRGRQMSAAI